MASDSGISVDGLFPTIKKMGPGGVFSGGQTKMGECTSVDGLFPTISKSVYGGIWDGWVRTKNGDGIEVEWDNEISLSVDKERARLSGKLFSVF